MISKAAVIRGIHSFRIDGTDAAKEGVWLNQYNDLLKIGVKTWKPRQRSSFDDCIYVLRSGEWLDSSCSIISKFVCADKPGNQTGRISFLCSF